MHQIPAIWMAMFSGVLLGALFDILAAVRVLLRRGALVTLAVDIIMGAAAGTAALWTLYRCNEGELRLILLAAMGIGWAVHRLGFGSLLRGLWLRLHSADGGKRPGNCE